MCMTSNPSDPWSESENNKKKKLNCTCSIESQVEIKLHCNVAFKCKDAVNLGGSQLTTESILITGPWVITNLLLLLYFCPDSWMMRSSSLGFLFGGRVHSKSYSENISHWMLAVLECGPKWQRWAWTGMPKKERTGDLFCFIKGWQARQKDTRSFFFSSSLDGYSSCRRDNLCFWQAVVK